MDKQYQTQVNTNNEAPTQEHTQGIQSPSQSHKYKRNSTVRTTHTSDAHAVQTTHPSEDNTKVKNMTNKNLQNGFSTSAFCDQSNEILNQKINPIRHQNTESRPNQKNVPSYNFKNNYNHDVLKDDIGYLPKNLNKISDVKRLLPHLETVNS
jgi:hypothetical protein